MLCMTETESGEKYRIREIKADRDMKKRLMELGVIKGTVIEKMKTAPSGDPVSYLVRGTEIALRRDCAGKITVTKLRDE